MGLRFRKRIGFGPFKINLSGSGISLSAGVRGASVNIPIVGRRKRKPSVSVGVPGTGLYYTQSIGGSAAAAPPPLPVNVATKERDRLLKIAYDRAVAGQPTEVREIMACAVIAGQQHNWNDDVAVHNAVMQAFPDLTESRLNAILSPLIVAIRDVGAEQRALDRRVFSRGIAVGVVIGVLILVYIF
ncbi:DUF4236 domain-containing protein [Bradyrhizobium sp. SRL28]|uniref:DUF4236 domain-containing protein n=1 Tax=Bradyrhizobium sp. SRL28 TaxID=2836178 RepID=UPI001BDE8C91|nr:DUF4236 domain-containing protein [Bradyrhizobium sp. SRL28]MBT1509423.1 DUF4236 domain-containing protein [Bradyrhizobium sp. SRL28]